MRRGRSTFPFSNQWRGDYPRHVEDERQPDLEDRRPVARLYQPNQYGELSQGLVGDDVAGIDRERVVRDIR
jgi:hypothetical protein